MTPWLSHNRCSLTTRHRVNYTNRIKKLHSSFSDPVEHLNVKCHKNLPTILHLIFTKRAVFDSIGKNATKTLRSNRSIHSYNIWCQRGNTLFNLIIAKFNLSAIHHINGCKITNHKTLAGSSNLNYTLVTQTHSNASNQITWWLN